MKAVLLREGQPVTEQISWNVMSPNYKILVYGNQVYCRLTGKHFESVDGVYLGMEMREVRRLYGEPDCEDGRFPYQSWSYVKEGVSVYFYGGIVDGIRIKKGSRKTFDRSGLNADSSRDSYAAYYAAGGPMNEFFTSGEDDSEYISLYEDCVHLRPVLVKKGRTGIFLRTGKSKKRTADKSAIRFFCEILPKVGEKARACYGHDTGDADGERTHGAFYRPHFHRPRRTHAVGGRTYGKTFCNRVGDTERFQDIFARYVSNNPRKNDGGDRDGNITAQF